MGAAQRGFRIRKLLPIRPDHSQPDCGRNALRPAFHEHPGAFEALDRPVGAAPISIDPRQRFRAARRKRGFAPGL
jgi:hypothetical protein